MVHICANRATVADIGIYVVAVRCGYVLIHIGRGAGRDTLVEILIRIQACGRRSAVVEIAIGIEIGAVNGAIRGAVNSLVDRAGRDVRVLVDVGRRTRLDVVVRVLVDIRDRARLDIVVRAG